MRTFSHRRPLRRRHGVLSLFVALVVAACSEPNAVPAPPPTEVGVVVVEPKSLSLDLEYPAQLRGVRMETSEQFEP